MQAEMAIEEADAIIFVVDAQAGITVFDEAIARKLRGVKKPVVVAVNKVDQIGDESKPAPFYQLGLEHVIAVSAMQGNQIAELLEMIFKPLEEKIQEAAQEYVQVTPDTIRVAIVGRPNVGKSTLLNHLLSEQRSIVSPIAGTTRDAIDALFEQDGQKYLLIDTAGIRRKKSEKDVVDKFAAIRTEEAIERADVCLLILDSYEGFTTQEKRIASAIEAKGKSCILLFNKWDQVKGLRMEHALRGVREAVPFLAYCPALFMSAKQGRNVNQILPLVQEVYQNRSIRLTTGVLNKFVALCIQKCHPPMIVGKRLRVYYLTQVESAPPKFVLFVNNPDLMVEAYRKFLVNQLRAAFHFTGAPLFFELRGKKRAALESEPTAQTTAAD